MTIPNDWVPVLEVEERENEAYVLGHKAGVAEGAAEAYRDAYDNGYEDGWDAAKEEYDPEHLAETLREEFRLAGFDSLKDVAVRYDAAEKALIWTQEGRSVMFR